MRRMLARLSPIFREYFLFETLRVSNHMACRFAGNAVFPPGLGRAAL